MSFKYGGPLIPGAFHYGSVPGLGVIGSQIPATGSVGPSYLYNDVLYNALETNEVRGYITRWPTAGILRPEADGNFVYTGGTDYFEYLLYVDGVPAEGDAGYGPGIGHVNLLMGISGDLAGAIALDGIAAAGAMEVRNPTEGSSRVWRLAWLRRDWPIHEERSGPP